MQRAVYDSFTPNGTLDQTCEHHGIDRSSPSRANRSWDSSVSESQPVDSSDIYIPTRTRGRPVSLSRHVEKDVVDVVRCFVDASVLVTFSKLLGVARLVVQGMEL